MRPRRAARLRGCGLALLGRGLGFGLRRVRLRRSRAVALRRLRLGGSACAFLFRLRAAIGLVPASALEHDRRRRHELAWLLAAARALLERRVGVRLDGREDVSAVVAGVVVDGHVLTYHRSTVRAGVLARPAVGVSKRRRILRENLLAYAFLAPAFLVLLVFHFLPGFA